jgi:predicted glutamine amidotransferase
MRNCFDNNNDGAGLAWVDEGGLHVKKGYFGFSSLWKDMRGLEGYPALLHCRLATHGSKIPANCHPFLLSNGVALAHNGIIDVPLLEKDMTDSESFAAMYVEPFSLSELRQDNVLNLLERSIGEHNKIAMLCEDGQFLMLNAERGQTFEDVWFSNDSFARSYSYYAVKTPMFDEERSVAKGEYCDLMYKNCDGVGKKDGQCGVCHRLAHYYECVACGMQCYASEMRTLADGSKLCKTCFPEAAGNKTPFFDEGYVSKMYEGQYCYLTEELCDGVGPSGHRCKTCAML